MKYLAAYLLLVQGGNASPSASDISSLLESVGVEVEESRLSTLLKDLEGKDINELIAEGNTKLASVPSGGAAAASGSGASGAAAGGAAEEAKEEAKEEEKEESDDDMGFGLFD
ncbi:RPP2B [Candida metapsilosis]|uniref:RPP2B n=1 Tax=Candida metapsilosis TaxID=273372 RepID=A0A8H7ZLS1_9ASCO|nr:RPP2B [Candida metapsilosis]